MEATDSLYFPIFMRLRGRRVLVVGGGEVALRKIRLLLTSGALIQVVARELCPELGELRESGKLQWLGARFEAAQLDGCRLAVAATDDLEMNRSVASAADARSIPVNVVDNPGLSSFISPSIINRAPVQIAVSSSGAAPVLARRLREKLETMLPRRYGDVAGFMGRMRERVRKIEPQTARRSIWEQFLDGVGAERIYAGDEVGAEKELTRIIDRKPVRGEVYLVGAGPGDPDLLTFRALRLMQQADVVLYDRLVSPAIMDLVRRDAERIFVGKQRNRHTVPQEEINQELARLALEGKRVLRLKGGDPFIFGRGGEEIQTLAAQGVPFQVVPGVTAASGCAAYAGIPLTHRDYAQACVFVTGHARTDGTLTLNWDMLARRGQTVAIYMGLSTLPHLCEQLITHGLPSDWPAALIEEGTSPSQRVIVATLGDLPQQVAAAAVSGASMLIVGEVVKLREQLRWFGEHVS